MKAIKVEPGTVLNSLSRIELIQLIQQQVEQIGLLKTENAALKHFADQKEAENKRLKELLKRAIDETNAFIYPHSKHTIFTTEIEQALASPQQKGQENEL